MDAIQKTLIKAGRKDLAKKYYKKITGSIKVSKRDAKEIAQLAGEAIFKRFEKELKKKYPDLENKQFDEATFNAYTDTIELSEKYIKKYMDGLIYWLDMFNKKS